EIHFRISGVKRAAMHAAAGRPANNHRSRRIPEIVSFGHKVRDLVECAHDEIDELHLANRTQAQIAHAASRADDGRFADRRIDDAFPAETLEQSFAGFESAAIDADVFAQQHDSRIALHLFKHRLLDGFKKGDLRRRGVSVRLGVSHDYLRAFREVAAGTGFAAFLLTDFAAVFGASFSSLSANWGEVSPKWIGAIPPLDPAPAPKPSTVHTAATLDFGGVASDFERSHFGR